MDKKPGTLNNNILAELTTFPHQGILWKIIDTEINGKIIALSSNCYLIHENRPEPFAFIVGDMNEDLLPRVKDSLRFFKRTFLYCHYHYHPLFIKDGWNIHPRVKFSLQKNIEDNRIDENLNIVPITDSTIFSKCQKYKELCTAYGSETNFLKHGKGYALCLNNEVVSECYATIARNVAELSVATNPNYRGRGFAPIIISHLIRECNKHNLLVEWTCDAFNKSSLFASLKLGFTIKDYYIMLGIELE